MIKRLKWNVLYGSDNELQGNGDLVSSDSDNDFEQASLALAELAKNDPRFRAQGEVPSEEDSEGDHFLREEFSEDGAEDDEEEKDDDDDAEEVGDEPDVEPEFIEWKECNLCPGKRFLHDEEVVSHVKSKGHARALRRYERQQAELQPDAEMQQASEGNIPAMDARPQNIVETDEQPACVPPSGKSATERSKNRRKKRLLAMSAAPPPAKDAPDAAVGDATAGEDNESAERKKQAAKRKLKKLKERKWKLAQARLQNSECPAEEAAREQAEILGRLKDADSPKAPRAGKGRAKSKLRTNARAMNSAVGGDAPNGSVRKGPKVKSKKPMSAEKAARKAKKRLLLGPDAANGNANGAGVGKNDAGIGRNGVGVGGKRAKPQGRARVVKKTKRSF